MQSRTLYSELSFSPIWFSSVEKEMKALLPFFCNFMQGPKLWFACVTPNVLAFFHAMRVYMRACLDLASAAQHKLLNLAIFCVWFYFGKLQCTPYSSIQISPAPYIYFKVSWCDSCKVELVSLVFHRYAFMVLLRFGKLLYCNAAVVVQQYDST